MVLASMYFALTGAFAKFLSDDMSSVEVVFFRNFIGLLLILVAIFKKPVHQRGGKPFLLIFRGAIGMLSLLAFFYNIAHMGLAEAFTFSKMAPIFVAIISAIFFKEKLNSISWIAILLGFVGVVLVMQPNLGFEKTDMMGIINGLFAALAYTSIHELRRAYDTRIIVLSFVASGAVFPLICMIIAQFYATPDWLDFMFAKFVMPDFFGFVFILMMGFSGVLFQTYLTKAYAASRSAGMVSAIGYCDIIFTLILGMMMGDSLPNFIAFLGIIIIIFSGVVVAMQK
ncbi:EamA/RhaT family transporter, type 1 [Campylobacter geochelonis]|nr:EamA/RhaT family transporter, type 1 [Campylobacter geochelonis]